MVKDPCAYAPQHTRNEDSLPFCAQSWGRPPWPFSRFAVCLFRVCVACAAAGKIRLPQTGRGALPRGESLRPTTLPIHPPTTILWGLKNVSAQNMLHLRMGNTWRNAPPMPSLQIGVQSAKHVCLIQQGKKQKVLSIRSASGH